MKADLVPALDAAGLPGPPWLFHVLLVFTFVLHLLFMNLTLGGTLLAWVSHLLAGGRSNPHGVLARRITAVNGFAVSLAITTGVAPLLFIQVLYQRFFYSGTILLGWIWFGLVVLLIAGYYALYLYKFRGAPSRGSGGGIWLGVAALAFLAIAMIHVGVHLIHTQPHLWSRFAVNPWLVLRDPTYWPRLLHFVLAGVAFSALVSTWWAARRAAAGFDVDVNTAIARTCWRWALGATALQMADGFLLLFVLPQEIVAGIMRGGVAVLGPLMASILLGMGLLFMLARPIDPVAHRGLVTGALSAVVLTVAVMGVTRHQVRALYLGPVAGHDAARVVPQWGNFALFVVLLLVALGTVAYMTKRVLTERATGSEAA